MDFAALNARFGQSGRISFQNCVLGGPVVEIATPASRAVVALQGAHVLSWRPAGMDDVLWAAPKARIVFGKAFRGGMPVCWPWFGSHASDPEMPAHGLARTAGFSVVGAEVSSDQTLIQFELDDLSPAQRNLWPYPARLAVTVWVGKALGLTLETTNAGSVAMPLSQALHTYFRVGDIAQAEVQGLEGVRFLDTLTGHTQTEAAPIRIGCEIDRIYQAGTGPLRLIDHAMKRRIQISSTGSASTVVWNPWIAKSQRLSDMGPDDYRHMLCLETANAGRDARSLEPGASHILSATIGVQAG